MPGLDGERAGRERGQCPTQPTESLSRPGTLPQTHVERSGVEPTLLFLDSRNGLLSAHPREHRGDVSVVEEGQLEPCRRRGRLLDGCAPLQTQPDLERTLVHVRQHPALQGPPEPEPGRQQHRRQRDDASPVIEGGFQDPVIPVRKAQEDPVEGVEERRDHDENSSGDPAEQPAEGVLYGLPSSKHPMPGRATHLFRPAQLALDRLLGKLPQRLAIAPPSGGHRGKQRKGYDQARHKSERHGEREGSEELTRHSLHVHDGPKHADRCERGGSDGSLHLFGTQRGRGHR